MGSAATSIEASLVSMRGTGFSPLMYAAEGGYAEACELLLLSGACVNAEDEDGMRPLHFASLSGCHDTCKVLLKGGAQNDARDDDGRIAMELLPPISCRKDFKSACEGLNWAASPMAPC